MSYQDLFDALPDPLLLLNGRLEVVICNDACEEYLGTDKLELNGSTLEQLLPNVELGQRVHDALQDYEDAVVEFPLAYTNGNTQMARAHATPMRWEGDEAYCLLRMEDVTEHTLLEQKLVHAEKRGEELRLLARSMAHEIGNPLSIMRSTLHYIEGILPRVESENLAQPIEMMDNMVTQIDELLQLLSDFSSSKQTRNKVIDIHYLLHQTQSLFEREATDRGISLQSIVEDDLPLYEGNPSAIRAMLINLVKNAMEAVTGGGAVQIRAYADLCPGTESLCLEVSDNGSGISQQKLSLIFKPFYSSKATGRGLGLSFCRRVTEEHGGEIVIESEPENGATFRVKLPYDKSRELS